MATSVAETKSANRVEPPKISVVNVLPPLGSVSNGEMFLLISTSDGDTGKIHIRIATGWIKTAALS